MTLNRLCEILNKLRAEHGRCRVSVDKSSFVDNRENDGCVILMIHGADVRWIQDADEDGGMAFNKDGSERGRTTVILFGDAYERSADNG
jgi:hypothetical protein